MKMERINTRTKPDCAVKVACIGISSVIKPQGGPDFVVKELSSRLAAHGIKTIVYSKACIQEKDFNGILELPTFAVRIPFFEFLSYSFISSFKAAMSDVNIVHYHTLISALFSFIPKLFRKKVLVTCHSLSFMWTSNETIKKSINILNSFSLLFNDRLTVVSKSLYNYYKKKKNIIYIPNGVTLPSLRNNQTNEKYILFCSRLVPGKGIHRLITAFQSIKSNCKLKICGQGDNTESYVRELKAAASNNKNIIFCGFVSGKEKESLFRNASIYVLPSEVEGMSVSLLEAMSYEIPVLVSDIQENKDVVLENGFYFKTNDTESLRKTLAYMLAHPNKLKQKAKKARQFVSKHFNWNVIVQKYYELYCQMLNKNS